VEVQAVAALHHVALPPRGQPPGTHAAAVARLRGVHPAEVGPRLPAARRLVEKSLDRAQSRTADPGNHATIGPLMRSGTFLRVLFVLYCIEVGVMLLLVPWSPAWDRAVIQVPSLAVHNLLLHPAMRGALSGFGLVHLVWGVHDLDRWLARRGVRARPST
jgi:hypothetical protein